MKVGSLGSVVFEASVGRVRTFEAVEESGSARLHQHEPALSAPVAEFVGPASRSIRFTVRLSTSLGVKPREEIAVLEAARDSGRLMVLTIGGERRGGPGAEWMIEQMSTQETGWGPAGETTIADVDLSLILARTASTPAPLGSTISKSGVERVR